MCPVRNISDFLITSIEPFHLKAKPCQNEKKPSKKRPPCQGRGKPLIPIKDQAFNRSKTKSPPRTYAKSLVQKLEKQGLKTLADIRRKGEIGVVKGLTKKQQADVQKLEAHAYLYMISEDIPLNEKLIVAGFRDISAIAAVESVALAKAAGISEEEAKVLQAKAAAALPAGADTTPVVLGSRGNGDGEEEVKACNSALSPLAYLEELLTYAAGNDETGVHGAYRGK